MFRLKPEEHAAAAQLAIESGETSPSVFCKSIVLDFLAGRLVPSTKHSEILFLAEKVGSINEGIGALNQIYESQFEQQTQELAAVRKEITEMARDTYDRISSVLKIAGRLDSEIAGSQKTATETYDEITNILGSVGRLERLTEDVHAALSTSSPSISDLTASVPERRRSATAFSGVDRRTSTEREGDR